MRLVRLGLCTVLAVCSLARSANGGCLASKPVKEPKCALVAYEQSTRVLVIPPTAHVVKAHFSNDSSQIAVLLETPDKRRFVRVWEAVNGSALGGEEIPSNPALVDTVFGIHRNELIFAEVIQFGANAGNRLSRIALGTGERIAIKDLGGWISGTVAICVEKKTVAFAIANEIRMYDENVDREIRRWPCLGHKCIAVSADGRSIAAGDNRGDIIVVDTEVEARSHRIKVSKHGIHFLAWSPNADLLVALSDDGRLSIVEVTAGRVRSTSSIAFPVACAFTRRRGEIIVLGDKGKVSLTSATDLKEITSISGENSRGLAISPDGTAWVLSDGIGACTVVTSKPQSE